MIRTIHKADYVLAEADLLLQNAAVHVSDCGRISRVEPWKPPLADLEAEVLDWGSAIILPGFVNTHTHLELTNLHNQLTHFFSFTDWLSQLIHQKQSCSQEDFLASVQEGVRMSLASGTTLLGDTISSGVSCDGLNSVKIRQVVFVETLSLSPDLAAESLATLNARLDQVSQDELSVSGVSPHAPYSVSPELYRRSAELARRKGKPLTTHVAETQEEIQFLETGTGEFRNFLTKLGVLPADWTPPRLPPILYLDALGVLERPCVLIHCNYLDRESMAKILKSRSSVVYCPRSHAFFGHAEHPVRQLLDFGINVALGTDSLASNSSLSILDEMRFVFKTRKDLKPKEIFQAATLNGAAALNLSGTVGRLRRGYCADLTILQLPPEVGTQYMLNQILEGAGECIATIVQGKIAWLSQQFQPDVNDCGSTELS